MTTNKLPVDRYGPVSFVVALAHVLVVDLVTWLFLPLFVLGIYALPLLLGYMAVAALIAKAPGKVGQAGRGMLIGCLSGPLTLIIFVPLWLLAKAIWSDLTVTTFW
jgi:hypothetical protein